MTVAHSGDFALVVEEELLSPEAAAVAAEGAVAADDAVAGDDDRDAVVAVGPADVRADRPLERV